MCVKFLWFDRVRQIHKGQRDINKLLIVKESRNRSIHRGKQKWTPASTVKTYKSQQINLKQTLEVVKFTKDQRYNDCGECKTIFFIRYLMTPVCPSDRIQSSVPMHWKTTTTTTLTTNPLHFNMGSFCQEKNYFMLLFWVIKDVECFE